MYARPINYSLQWASSGVRNPPTQEKITYGWTGAEKPMVEHLNWIFNRIDGAIGYLLQGVPRWGSEVDYSTGDIVNSGGKLYVAISANSNKPVTNTTYWKESFYSSIDGETLEDEISNIKNTDGYLNKYLKISDPATPNRVRAGSYVAKSGVPLSPNYNVGYGFSTALMGESLMTGMYLNDTTIEFRIGNTIKASVPSAVPALTDSSNNVATTDWVQRLIESKIGTIDVTASRLPVGAVFICVNDQNPNALLGYGTWVRFAEGQVIVGKSTKDTDPAWTKTTYNAFGSNGVTLLESNLPPHGHSTAGSTVAGGTESMIPRSGGQGTWSWIFTGVGRANTPDDTFMTSKVGNSVPVSVVQPSIVANIWRRTA